MNRKCTKAEAGVLRAIRDWPNGYTACPGTETHYLLNGLLAKGWVKVLNGKVFHFLNAPRAK